MSGNLPRLEGEAKAAGDQGHSVNPFSSASCMTPEEFRAELECLRKKPEPVDEEVLHDAADKTDNILHLVIKAVANAFHKRDDT